MANSLGWANTAVAATYSLTLLFLRTPLLGGRSAADVAQRPGRVQQAEYLLADTVSRRLPAPEPHPHWQTLELRDVCFHYPDNSFAVGPINLTLQRGELVFLIGGNGSGKSTLAMLLTGLYQPASGQILLDGQPLRRTSPKITASFFGGLYRCLAVRSAAGAWRESGEPCAGRPVDGVPENDAQTAAG